MRPFLRWPGGKRWLTSDLAQAIGDLTGDYIEPFLGGGALFFALKPKTGLLSDINPRLIELYNEIKTEPRRLKQLLRSHQRLHDHDYYDEERARRHTKPHTRAAHLLYLNRSCFNGIYRVNRNGDFNVPIGTRSQIVMLDDDFVSISQLMKNVRVEILDFEVAINQAGQNDVIYADPPYTVQHNKNGFLTYNENLFTWKDQQRLAAALGEARDKGARVFLSNADHESIRSLYNDGWTITECSRHSVIAGMATSRRKTSELLITSEKIQTSQLALPLDTSSDVCPP